MIMALDVKNKTGFVDGTITKPSITDTPLLYAAWKRANALVLVWIVNSCLIVVRSTILSATNARDLWLELKMRFTKSDGPRIFHLEKSLSSIKQGSNSICVYYGMFKKLWDEYVAHRPVSTCDRLWW